MSDSPVKRYADYWLSEEYRETPRHYRAVNFFLSTACNRRCPECAVNVPLIRHPEHYPIAYVRHAASILHGIEHVSITGGEPMLHPQFRKMAPKLKKWFGCASLTLESNGFNLPKYRRLMKYFDDVMISHYEDNREEIELARSLGLDGRPDGRTLHVTTARRAWRPAVCQRANFLMYVFGRAYPCACIPDGYACIGIPLTERWRREILDVPMPCADCCFAEEAKDDRRIVPPVDRTLYSPESIPCDPGQDRDSSRWPAKRDDIKMFGLDLDSWMGREAIIRINPAEGDKSLVMEFESWVPPDVHPLALSFIGANGSTVATHIIHEQGNGSVRLDLAKFVSGPGESSITVHCDKVYTGSGRELGVRVRTLRYQLAAD